MMTREEEEERRAGYKLALNLGRAIQSATTHCLSILLFVYNFICSIVLKISNSELFSSITRSQLVVYLQSTDLCSFISSSDLYSRLANSTPFVSLSSIWRNFVETMTIEVISVPTPSALPILRLNSLTMEEYLNSSEISSSYGTSDECDSGLVFTDSDHDVELCDNTSFVPENNNCSRRDSSDSSEFSSEETSKVGKFDESKTEKLVSQVEVLFSDEHLAKDGFLLKHVRRRTDGYVSLKLVAGLRKVKQISREFSFVLNALKESKKLEVNGEGTKVRRVEPLTDHLKSLPVGGKEKENRRSFSNGASSDSAQEDIHSRKNMYYNNNYGRRGTRTNSIVSSGSSAPGSRHGSFSKDPSNNNNSSNNGSSNYRNMMVYSEDAPRRRGGSLPVPMVISSGGQHHYFNSTHQGQKRASFNHAPSSQSPPLSSSPPATYQQNRPKSHSYCEGVNVNGRKESGGMSVWLAKRQASSRATENNTNSSSTILRQPRGPDGSKGFSTDSRLKNSSLVEEI